MSTHMNHRRLPPGSPLIGLCQSLIVQEETCLQTTLAELNRVRAMLASSEPQALDLALQSSNQAAVVVGKVQEKRHEFRAAAGRILNLPPANVTLSAVADHFPAVEASAVRSGQQRLKLLAQEIAQVNHGNAIIAWWCLDFVNQVFSGLQGHSSGHRYGAGGKVQPAVCGPTWQGQG